MIRHDDKSVTLTEEEWQGLGRAYQDLYETLDRVPSTLRGLFTTAGYLRIKKWSCHLKGEEFKRSDWL